MHYFPFSKEAREAEAAEAKLAHERKRDNDIAAAQAFHAIADLHMPADLRDQAQQWKLEAFMEAVWRAGWQSGFRFRCKNREGE
jgi:hypothetical protein